MICSCRLAQRAGGSGGKARVDETRCEMMHFEVFLTELCREKYALCPDHRAALRQECWPPSPVLF